MQVLDGRLIAGNQYRITPYVIQITSPDGELIRNIEIQSLGDTKRRQNTLTCWMRDGTTFNLGFVTDTEATEALSVIQREGTETASSFMSRFTPRQIAIAVCALGVVIGSFGPWAKVWIVTADGLDGDGKLTIVLGILALIGVFVRVSEPHRRGWIMYGLVAALGIATIIGVYDWSNIDKAIGELEDNPFAANASVGWGLQLMTISSMVGVIVTSVEMMSERQTPDQAK